MKVSRVRGAVLLQLRAAGSLTLGCTHNTGLVLNSCLFLFLKPREKER